MSVILITNNPVQIGYLKNICEEDIVVFSILANGQAKSQFENICNLLNISYRGDIRGRTLRALFLIIKFILTSKKIFLGDYNSGLCVIIVNARAIFKKVSIYLADGVNICRFSQRAGQKQRFTKLYTYLVSSLNYDRRFEFKKFSLPDVKVNMDHELIKSLEENDWILGTPDVADNFITFKNYIQKVEGITSKRGLVYLAHRRELKEDLAKISDIMPVIKQNYSIEWVANSINKEILREKIIYHFGSTAAITLRAILSSVYALKLVPYFKQDVSEIYWKDYQSNIAFIDNELILLGNEIG